ncbi:helix-turn-helix domain-containing protein [Streptomyces mirabilis]|nr:helix-turn-helix domain-containing protein [Streptomyces mirabilis]
MDTQNPSAPPRAQSRIAGKNHPHQNAHARPAGVIHDNTRHTTRFTVIGNHLAQHPELSGLAIGLAVYIQSLPTGARVDIKTLAARFPEGPTRIAAALRELETHGYLRRTRERTPAAGSSPARSPATSPDTAERQPTPQQACPTPGPSRTPAPQAPPHRARARVPSPTLLGTAADLLAGLRHHDSRLLLSVTDTEHLAPGVAAWLERDLTPTAVQHALTTDLPPEDLRRPAALLAHRLAAQLPPPPPFRAPAPLPDVRHPLQNCEGCDRAFRSPGPGHCRDCRSDLLEAA